MSIARSRFRLTSGIIACASICGALGDGCASGASEMDYDGGDYTDAPNAPTAAPGEFDGPTLPPEKMDSFYRAAPAGTDIFVFVVNPDRDTVSKINATTQAVYTLPVGTHPTQVLVGSDNPDKALVLNEGDATLSILNTRTDEIRTVSIHKDTNYMEISSDGQYAITYFNPNVEDADTDINGVRSYSNISVVFTGDGSTEPTSTPLAVELNPRAATFVEATGQALVLCDDALAQIDLSPQPGSRLIRLTDDIDEDLGVAEIKVGPDGRYAFLRLSNEPDLLVVDLAETEASAAVSRVSLSAIPSDMDMADEELILVDRANHNLEVFAALDPAADPVIIPTPEDLLIGSIALAPTSSKAILYTTLTEADIVGTEAEDIPLNRFSVWDLETDTIESYKLVKPVKGVSVGNHTGIEVVTIIHDGEANSDVEAFDGQEAFSNYYFSDDLVIPTALEAPIKDIAQAADGGHEFMILEDNLNVVVVDYLSRQVDAVSVQSQPAFVGSLTSMPLGYVSQEHELGRLSFIDPEALTVTTITGFELNSQY